jgi:hypothetical protein
MSQQLVLLLTLGAGSGGLGLVARYATNLRWQRWERGMFRNEVDVIDL